MWDGKDPDNAVEPYLKSLKGWLNTTRTLKTQRGMTILHYAVGDLKTIINEIDIDTLCADGGGDRVFEHIKESYSEYLEKELPKAMERALYSNECRRRKDESMLQYVARKRTLFAELDRAKCPLPSQAKGYIMLRDSQIGNRAWDTIETWTRGTYQVADIATNLRKLERPVPGRGGTHMGFDGFQEDESLVCYEDHGDTPLSESSGVTMIFMTESLFVLPECFDEELLVEAMDTVEDPDIVYVAGDMPDRFCLPPVAMHLRMQPALWRHGGLQRTGGVCLPL